MDMVSQVVEAVQAVVALAAADVQNRIPATERSGKKLVGLILSGRKVGGIRNGDAGWLKAVYSATRKMIEARETR